MTHKNDMKFSVPVCKWSSAGTQPCSLVSAPSRAAFAQQHSPVVVRGPAAHGV